MTLLITPSGPAVVGMSYVLTCTVSGTDNLEATINPIAFSGPSTTSGSGTSLELPFGILTLTDAGEYTCIATVSSGLLTSDLELSDTEAVNIPSESLSKVVMIAVLRNHCWLCIEPTLEKKVPLLNIAC